MYPDYGPYSCPGCHSEHELYYIKHSRMRAIYRYLSEHNTVPPQELSVEQNLIVNIPNIILMADAMILRGSLLYDFAKV